MENQNNTVQLKERLTEIYSRNTPPEKNSYIEVLDKVNNAFRFEDQDIRPPDSTGQPGGLLYLKQDIPTIIVPDIHARMEFFISIMLFQESGLTCLERMEQGELQIVCVGDGVHAEKRAARRWLAAYEEYQGKYKEHVHIDEEMKEGFGVMEMIMEAKSAFPSNFHFLKGNHENISNEEGGGNHPFMKFSDEGSMVAFYVQKFYGEEFMNKYYIFEKNMPVLAVGRNFLISHAEPEMLFNKEDIIDYRNHPEVVEGLTWTANDAALPSSVDQMIETYIAEEQQGRSYQFGGHRPITGLYNERAGGKYIQIHNPDKFIIANIVTDRDIDLEQDIIEIENQIDKIKAESQ